MAAVTLTAIILAAGRSERFGPDNKLLSLYKGVRLIDHCLNTVLASNFDDRILVTGHENAKIDNIVKNLPVRTVYNEDYAEGMGTSLATGIRALNPSCDAFMVFLADMPDISPDLVKRIVEAYQAPSNTNTIIRPTFRAQPGHPVLFSARHSSQLAKLKGEQGAGSLIAQNTDKTLNILCKTPECIYDIDK